MNHMETTFQCSQCGACCRYLASHLPEGTIPLRADGSCAHLLDDNRCAIYENRPTLCDVAELYNKLKHDGLQMSRAEYYVVNYRACNELQEKVGIDAKYRLPLL